ncbi:glutathione S-transferase N-terminal domain-containing protein [Ottowia testudinis]|uniref:Glutathione S-transferase N-terminal domain-containing protein n=1 Tax=Ottowia testudinis TaxID=2816950 RepID=A0A975CP73_9BURK|nr:glutathione S-transferase N-terminal domain-containing protein [Ottowia testudinis]QTD47143.1 glutathione S-transferase N-terminal domain-containing protein [Ottowia testudinis]
MVSVAMLPVLYTFRRCPYAMRARWALHAAGVAVEMREILLRDKPPALLAASPKGTVPVLVLPGGAVIDQSLHVMHWALAQRDPQGWLAPERGTLADMLALIEACERDFKPHLDRGKYASRYRTEWVRAGHDEVMDKAAFAARNDAQALLFLQRLACVLQAPEAENTLNPNAASAAGRHAAPCLSGSHPALADFAIVPFVRQFARHDAARFAAQAPPSVAAWMNRLLARGDFEAVMAKRAVWSWRDGQG